MFFGACSPEYGTVKVVDFNHQRKTKTKKSNSAEEINMKKNRTRNDRFYDFIASLAFVFDVDWDNDYETMPSPRAENLIELPIRDQQVYKDAV